MLLCFVFAKLHPRRSPRFSNLLTHQRLNVPTGLSPKSLPHNLFADSHPLNPYATIFYKNSGGAGPAMLSTFNVPTCKRFNASSGGSPIFRTLFQVPYPASPLFATLTKTPGVWEYSSHSGTHLSTSCSNDLQPIPFPFTLLRTLLHNELPYHLHFHVFAHSFRRDGGCPLLFSSTFNQTSAALVGKIPTLSELSTSSVHSSTEHGSRCGFFARGVRLAD